VDSNAVRAVVTGAIWLLVVLVLRALLNFGFDRYERRLAETDPSVAARRRTTYSFLLRMIVALVGILLIFVGAPAVGDQRSAS